jgi:hypothetical protein
MTRASPPQASPCKPRGGVARSWRVSSSTKALNDIYNLTPGTLEPVRAVSVILTWTY